MILELKGHTEDTWWIVKKTDNSLIHYGLTPVGRRMQSGLDEKETFTSELNWANKLLDYDLIITGETSENIVYTGGTWVSA
jgi:hypothetical protein